MQVVALPKSKVRVRLFLDLTKRLSEEAYLAFCEANPNLRVERTAEGEVILMPPAGIESDYRSLDAAAQLRVWEEKDGRGKAFGPTAQFMLPDGSALSPDAAWVSLGRLTREQRRKFAPLAPEFIVEVRSPSDRLKSAKERLVLWIDNDVQLAWLIDGDAKTVHIYRKDGPTEARRGIQELAGEGAVRGFVLQLRSIWAGLA